MFFVNLHYHAHEPLETCKMKVARGYKFCQRYAYIASNGTCLGPFVRKSVYFDTVCSLCHVWEESEEVYGQWALDTRCEVFSEVKSSSQDSYRHCFRGCL